MVLALWREMGPLELGQLLQSVLLDDGACQTACEGKVACEKKNYFSLFQELDLDLLRHRT